ncbi:uncharacterized protein CTRU02_206675 [Colletotrichum truncatum]|uniref:Uncharacterized protein n=1 Tax=Colletotrichum truncatum TaxID=5467 RepID=A0ACC3Z7S0_COLTU|nr:uncharacterized protein CTRU02_13796 [Colletotrichum truncatum]KAF6782970.1 hypothetical protein CTRU02_13796 [Colletotrichum truncatum]
MASTTDTFPGLLKPTARPYELPKFNGTLLLIKDGFTLTTLLTIGALMQTVLFLILPTKYAIIPSSVLALNSIISTIVGTYSKKHNPYLNGIVPGVVTAQFPDPATGKIPAIPARRPLLVFHLGLRFNHPLGILAPGREIGEYFDAMNKDLKDRADEYGLYHVSSWQSMEAERNNTLMFIYYFRDIEGLNKFAHDPVHRKGWDWYNSIRKEYTHLGIFHEAFVTGAQQYETIYGNMKPVLLGAASVKCKNEETKEDEWVNTLVNGNVGPLRSQFRRMGKASAQLTEYIV